VQIHEDDPFKTIIDDVHKLLIAKHHDYGTDNLDEFGVHGVLIRISDKRNRIKHMHERGVDGGMVGEKEEQEWIDIAGYAIQAIRMIREESNRHNADTEDAANGKY